MSLWSSLLNIGGKILDPFTGGLASTITGAAGAAFGAFGGAGNQGSVNQNQTQNQTGHQTQNQTTNNTTSQTGGSTIDQTTLGFETPEMAALRSAQMRRLQGQFGRANQPIYGEPQKAGFISNLNDLAASAGENLKQHLASSGALDSGRAAQGFGDIERGRVGQAGQFFAGLPFMEQQAQSQRFNDLFGLANNFLATGPRGQRTTGGTTFNQAGEAAGTQSGTLDSTNTSTSTGQTNQQGPSFAHGFLGNIGGALGNLAANGFGGGGKDVAFDPFSNSHNPWDPNFSTANWKR